MYHGLTYWNERRPYQLYQSYQPYIEYQEDTDKKKNVNDCVDGSSSSVYHSIQKTPFPTVNFFWASSSGSFPSPNNSIPREHIINVLGGMVQATTVTITGYPLDLVKSRLQAKMYPNTMSCLVNTIKNEGFMGLYRGAAMPWLSHMVKRPVQYPISEYLKKKTNGCDHNIFYNYLIGGATGLVGPVFGTPLQVVKIAMQTSESGTKTSKNSWHYIKHNYKNNGIQGFYRGFFPTAAKDMIFGMSFIGTYYTLRDVIGTDRWYKNFANGALAHCLTWCVFIPIDYVKTIVQRSEQKLKVSDVIKTSYQRHGITIFWKGVIPACLRTIPVSGCAMMSYEYIRVQLEKVI